MKRLLSCATRTNCAELGQRCSTAEGGCVDQASTEDDGGGCNCATATAASGTLGIVLVAFVLGCTVVRRLRG